MKILITGGTGSFGNAIVEKLLTLDSVEQIRIFSRDEKKQYDMRNKFNDNRIDYVIGDVRDYNSVLSAMDGITHVFSAAALKQVPSCETFPVEAIKTNVLGSVNVLDAAIAKKVQKVVMLSTDKAVYPINTMGMTKALMEKILISKSYKSEDTIICGTRYGNVMGSRGSVIPHFVNLIKQNKPLTVTSYDMTRFMMSLDDATELVLHALFAENCNGHIYIKKSPACTMATLVEAFKQLFNYDKVEVIGYRQGEKKHETLATAVELSRAIEKIEYFDIYPEYSMKNGIIYDDYTSDTTTQLNVAQVIELLQTLTVIKEGMR